MTRFFAAATSIVFTLMVAIFVPTHHSYAADETVIEAVSDYLMFQEYQSGIILPQQIDDLIGSKTALLEHYSESPMEIPIKAGHLCFFSYLH